jgi:hypothetical protein
MMIPMKKKMMLRLMNADEAMLPRASGGSKQLQVTPGISL